MGLYRALEREYKREQREQRRKERERRREESSRQWQLYQSLRVDPKFYTQKGELVRSKSEQRIADFFFRHNIPYQYERFLILEKHPIKPDFFLPTCGVYVEFWGMLDKFDYWKDFNWKVDMYRKHGIRFVPLRKEDLDDLDRIFFEKLKQALAR